MCGPKDSRLFTLVIFVSTLGTADDEVAGFEAGCNGYIPKPYTPHMLVVRMEALLRFLKRRESIALERAWEAARQNRDIEENGNAL
jgi:DNA-binding response OmpR family regulator